MTHQDPAYIYKTASAEIQQRMDASIAELGADPEAIIEVNDYLFKRFHDLQLASLNPSLDRAKLTDYIAELSQLHHKISISYETNFEITFRMINGDPSAAAKYALRLEKSGKDPRAFELNGKALKESMDSMPDLDPSIGTDAVFADDLREQFVQAMQKMSITDKLKEILADQQIINTYNKSLAFLFNSVAILRFSLELQLIKLDAPIRPVSNQSQPADGLKL